MCLSKPADVTGNIKNTGLLYKSFMIVSYDHNNSVQSYKTFYRRKLQKFAMS
jgi:hypothetical protein